MSSPCLEDAGLYPEKKVISITLTCTTRKSIGVRVRTHIVPVLLAR
jgi:hypothetical protein